MEPAVGTFPILEHGTGLRVLPQNQVFLVSTNS